jgi:hypothetical protein
MAILRKHNRKSYTVIDNDVFRDSELSNKALGMLCRMLSLPDGWEFSVRGLSKLSDDGVDGVMSQLNELEKRGYLKRRQIRDKGKLAGVEYIVSEAKMIEDPVDEKPHTENPDTVKPHTEKGAQSNNKQSITESSIKKEINREFDNLWILYPRKQGKDKAQSYYEKARKSGTTYEEVEQGILAYKAYIDAEEIDKKYIKQGSTFFSQRAWQDDWSVQPRSTGNPYLDMLMEGDYQ